MLARRPGPWWLAAALSCARGEVRDDAAAASLPQQQPVAAAVSAPEHGTSIPALRPIAARRLRHATLVLAHDAAAAAPELLIVDADGVPQAVPCDALTGAWGLWVDDVDDDGRAEAIVALHKPARFDPVANNRLHVYGFERGRCVPAWRGTRLSGRFDGVAVDADRRGTLRVHEWLSPVRRRVARYRWSGFGYALADVLWEGEGPPPASLVDDLQFGPRPGGTR